MVVGTFIVALILFIMLFFDIVNRISSFFLFIFMIFFERLQALMDSQNLTQKQLADNTGIRQGLISEWKKNGNLPSGETAIKIADYFKVSLDYLLTGEEKNNEYSPDEIELISNYRSLQDHDKSMLQVMVSAMASNQD